MGVGGERELAEDHEEQGSGQEGRGGVRPGPIHLHSNLPHLKVPYLGAPPKGSSSGGQRWTLVGF